MGSLQTPLTDLQLELLKVYASGVTNEELLDIKQLLFEYFAKRSIAVADEVWVAKGWTDADAERMLHTHFRTPYKHLQ